MNLPSKLTLSFVNFTSFLRGKRKIEDVQFCLQYSFNFSSHFSVLSDSVDEREEKENGRTSLLNELLTYTEQSKIEGKLNC